MPHSVHGSSATMSRPSSTSTASANAFPKPVGATLLAPESTKDQLSPARSTFSFDSQPRSAQTGSEKGNVTGDASTSQPSSRVVSGHTRHRSGPRTQFFEEQFQYKNSTSSARERVTKDAPIIADLRTNVIIKDEYTLVTDLSHHLSQRYQRPESTIMITVAHSACLLLGGSFEPTYVLTISALPVQLQPTTNKRNAALIQNFMFESTGVQLDRGIVKFVPIPEECLATNGTTVFGDIERLERQQGEDNSALKRALTKTSKRSLVGKAKSSIQLSRHDSKPVGGRDVKSPLPGSGPFDSGVAVNEEGKDGLGPLYPTDGAPTKKSFSNQASSKGLKEKYGANLTPPAIPEDSSAPRIGKRKSFMTMFRR